MNSTFHTLFLHNRIQKKKKKNKTNSVRLMILVKMINDISHNTFLKSKLKTWQMHPADFPRLPNLITLHCIEIDNGRVPFN